MCTILRPDGLYEFNRPLHPEEVLTLAEQIMRQSFKRADLLQSPEQARRYCIHHLARREREVFLVIWLDTRHQVLAVEELFEGCINGAPVFPREVVASAIRHKAGAAIFAHQHPSGLAEPSACDRKVTRDLQAALSLIDIRVLDHIIVGGADTFSFAESGLL